jgi:hypothetical protein
MATPARGPTPHDRYGTPSRARRATLIGVVSLVAAAFLAWLAWAALHQAGEGVSGQLTGFTVQSPHAVQVTIEVQGAGGDAVVCTVEARAADHGLVGSQDITIPAEESGSQPYETTLRTDREATTASVTGCRR